MARTPSNMLPLGTKAPAFSLPDTVSGKTLSLDKIHGKNGTVVMFICNHCPFVKHVFKGIVDLANDYADKGISFVAISSNDVENYPDDAPDLMTKVAAEQNFPFPYLYDKTQDVARAYDAACTPDFYNFDFQNHYQVDCVIYCVVDLKLVEVSIYLLNLIQAILFVPTKLGVQGNLDS